MKKRFQLIALLAVALLGACSGGKDKVAVEQVSVTVAGRMNAFEAFVRVQSDAALRQVV